MTNQLFCLATHLRLAMLCLQLGKSCWVLVLDSFFRHEEMSQLRFAETLFSCQFFQAGYTASNELPHGGNGKTNQHVGEMMMIYDDDDVYCVYNFCYIFQITVITYDYVALS